MQVFLFSTKYLPCFTLCLLHTCCELAPCPRICRYTTENTKGEGKNATTTTTAYLMNFIENRIDIVLSMLLSHMINNYYTHTHILLPLFCFNKFKIVYSHLNAKIKSNAHPHIPFPLKQNPYDVPSALFKILHT